MALRPIYEVCEKETGYDRGGRCYDPWQRQTCPREKMRDTIKNILVVDRAQKQAYGSGSKRRMGTQW